jgi:hypothetical protein
MVADALAKAVDDIPSSFESFVVDATTFTHESLLVLLRTIANNGNSFSSIKCLYTGAEDYSVGDRTDNIWLSKGCKDVRNVIGYPGKLRPVAKTNLIILTGFEIERATKLIDLVQPDHLILGNGTDPVADKHKIAMNYFKERFTIWKREYKRSDVETFDFSCKDIENTVNTVQSIIDVKPEENFILVPLNTKLSTIAAAIVSFSNPRLQVCYSIPEVYNYDNYSIPGENVTIIDMKSTGFFGKIQMNCI